MAAFGDSGADALENGDRRWGLVVATQANYYRVQLDGDAPPAGRGVLLCTRRARLKKTSQQVMVGDRVAVEAIDWGDGRGAIAAVQPRHTLLDRPPVANAEQVLLVFALAEPDFDPQQAGRFLVKAEATGLAIHVCLNKRDLVSDAACRHWQDQLRQWGYGVTALSLQADADDLDPLRRLLRGRTTVVCGPSGVGKSSLINRLIPRAALRTGAVSGKLGRGRHTTRHVELLTLPGGGFLADTPGFNQPDVAIAPLALGQCFPEIRQHLADAPCQFKDCLHRGEEGCAVPPTWPRADLYLTLLEEAVAYGEACQRQRDPDAPHKVRIGEKGLRREEPLLQAKRYRRPSRRRQNQDLNDLRHSLERAADEEDTDPQDPEDSCF